MVDPNLVGHTGAAFFLRPAGQAPPIFAGPIITQGLGEHQADDPTAEPAYGSRGLLETGLFENGIVRSLLEA